MRLKTASSTLPTSATLNMKTLLLVIAITALAVGYNVLLVSQGPSLHKAIHGPDAKAHKSTPAVR